MDAPDEPLRRALLQLVQAQSDYAHAYRAWKMSPSDDASLAALRDAERRADEARLDAGRVTREATMRVDVRPGP